MVTISLKFESGALNGIEIGRNVQWWTTVYRMVHVVHSAGSQGCGGRCPLCLVRNVVHY